MKNLWAPWRMDYILSDKEEDGCIFCPGDDRKKDKERLILYTGDNSMVIMNKYPYSNGHLLVAPVKHVYELEDLSDEENLDLICMVKKTVSILKQTMKPEGINVGLNIGSAAGAGIEEHMHFHVVPRWNGDNNFMTVINDIRLIPEHIKETYNNLFPYFRDL